MSAVGSEPLPDGHGSAGEVEPAEASGTGTATDKAPVHGLSYLISFIPLAVFLSTWVGSVVVFPAAAYLSLCWRFHHLTWGLSLYYGFRLFFRLRKWDAVVRHLHCGSQGIHR